MVIRKIRLLRIRLPLLTPYRLSYRTEAIRATGFIGEE
jgi:hypothetical protein